MSSLWCIEDVISLVTPLTTEIQKADTIISAITVLRRVLMVSQALYQKVNYFKESTILDLWGIIKPFWNSS